LRRPIFKSGDKVSVYKFHVAGLGAKSTQRSQAIPGWVALMIFSIEEIKSICKWKSIISDKRFLGMHKET
jgi:hypothetical protein